MPPFSYNQSPCSYWPDIGRTSRNAFDLAAAPIMRSAEEWRAVKFHHLQKGAQASSNGMYHVVCPTCPKEQFCRAARVDLSRFEMSASQQKKFEYFKEHTSLTVRPASSLDEEIYELYKDYIQGRHADAKTDMLEYSFKDLRISYARNALALVARAKNNALMAVSIIDQYQSSYSAEYQVYDLKHASISPGVGMTLTALSYMKEQHPDGHMYFGPWSPGSPKLGYKTQFKGIEIFTQNEWLPFNAG